MAATIARAQGFKRDGGGAQQGEQTALGHGSAVASANTYQTFAEVEMRANGSGLFTLKGADGATIHEYTWGLEANR